jgi:Ca-activated chloride channel family protein
MELADTAPLWWLAPALALLAMYAAAQGRRSPDAVPHPSVALLRAAMATRTSTAWRRHLPAGVILVSMILAAVALTRPALRTPVPRERTTIVLVLDTSGSMQGRDLFPSRLAAAQAAARSFVGALPEGFRVGVVQFASQATLVQPVTDDLRAVRRAIDGLEADGGTAIGDGLQVALASLPPETFAAPWLAPMGTGDARSEIPGGPPVPPAVVLLLTDGQNTEGPDPRMAAGSARDQGVPVFTIGIGGRAAPFGSGANRSNGVDEALLTEIAAETGGQYYFAPGAGDLSRIYADLGRALGWDWERREIGHWFGAGALAAAVLATVLASFWLDRAPRPGALSPSLFAP